MIGRSNNAIGTLAFRAVAEVSLRSFFMNAALFLTIFRLPTTPKINQLSSLTGSPRRRPDLIQTIQSPIN